MWTRLIRMSNEILRKIAFEWDYEICENSRWSDILNLLSEINMESKFYNGEIIDIAEVQNHCYKINYCEWFNASKPKLCLLYELEKRTFVL